MTISQISYSALILVLSWPKRLHPILIKSRFERSTIKIEFLLIVSRLILNIIVLLEWHVLVSVVVLVVELLLVLILMTSDVVVLSEFILLLWNSLMSSKNCGILLRQLSEYLLTVLNLD